MEWLLAAIVGAVTVESVRIFAQFALHRRGTFKGPWVDFIEAQLGQEDKVDQWSFQSLWPPALSLEGVAASIERSEPAIPERRWHFRGRERRGALIGHFWNKMEGDPSMGAITLAPHNDQPGVYTGYYLRIRDGVVLPFKISLRQR